MSRELIDFVKQLNPNWFQRFNIYFEKLDQMYLANHPELWRRNIAKGERNIIYYFIFSTIAILLFCCLAKISDKAYIETRYFYILSFFLSFNTFFFVFFMNSLVRKVNSRKFFFFDILSERLVLKKLLYFLGLFHLNGLLLSLIPYLFFTAQPNNIRNDDKLRAVLAGEYVYQINIDSTINDDKAILFLQDSIVKRLDGDLYQRIDTSRIRRIVNKITSGGNEIVFNIYYNNLDIEYNRNDSTELSWAKFKNHRLPISQAVNELNSVDKYSIYFLISIILIFIIASGACYSLIYVYFGTVPDWLKYKLPSLKGYEELAVRFFSIFISVAIALPIIAMIIDILIIYMTFNKVSETLINQNAFLTELTFFSEVMIIKLVLYLIIFFIIILSLIIPYIFYHLYFQKLPIWKQENLGILYAPD